MNRRIVSVAAAALLVGGALAAPAASANGSFAVSIGVPGFGVGFSNNGVAVVAPPLYAPYVAPPVAVVAPPVVYHRWHRPYAPVYYRAPARVYYRQ